MKLNDKMLQKELEGMKLKNTSLQQDNDDLHSRLDIEKSKVLRYKALVKKYQKLKDEKQPDTTVKDDLVCTYRIIVQ